MEEGKYRMITKFIEDVIKLPYRKNPQYNPLHEKQVESLLKKHKIRYKAQPNGSQKFPDFRLLDYELDLECKSSANYKPMWNRGIPRPDALYIITCKKLNRTNIFFGKYVLSKEEREFVKGVDKAVKAYCKKLMSGHNGVWTVYCRNAFDNMIKNKIDGGSYKSFYWNETFAKKVLEYFK